MRRSRYGLIHRDWHKPSGPQPVGLYHGTSRRAFEEIMQSGGWLRPLSFVSTKAYVAADYGSTLLEIYPPKFGLRVDSGEKEAFTSWVPLKVMRVLHAG